MEHGVILLQNYYTKGKCKCEMDLASISTFQFHTLKYSILVQTNLILLKTCFPNGAWLLATSNRNELQISVSFNFDHRGLNDLDIKIGLSENAKKTFPKMTATSYSGQGGVQYFSANIKCKKKFYYYHHLDQGRVQVRKLTNDLNERRGEISDHSSFWVALTSRHKI